MRGKRAKRLHLTDDEVTRLNAEFYGSFPYGEMAYQIAATLLMLDPRDEFIHLLTTNSPCGELHVRMDETTPEAFRGAAALGLLAHSQHLAETLLRLLYVHARREPCTWAALAKLRDLGIVHNIASQVLAGAVSTPAGKRDVSEVVSEHILGNRCRTPPLPEDHDAQVANTVEWVKYAASIANGSHLYNGYKHGLALSYRPPIPLAVKVGDESYDDAMDPSIAYLRKPIGSEAARCLWVQDFDPVDAEQRGVGCLLMLHLIGDLILFGARERSVRPVVEKPTFYPVSFTPESVARKKCSPVVMGFSPREYGAGEDSIKAQGAVEQAHPADGAKQ